VRGLNRDHIGKIGRFTCCKNFVGKSKKFIFNAFVDLSPLERFENGGDIDGRGYNCHKLVFENFTGDGKNYLKN